MEAPPPWLIVLRYWQMRKSRNGLTLPFLVGVQRYSAGDIRGVSARGCLCEVLEQARRCMLEHDGYFLIHRCDDVQTLILTEVSNTRPSAAQLTVPAPDGTGRCTLVADLDTPIVAGDPLGQLLDLLCAAFGRAIDEERYSRRGQRGFERMSQNDYDVIDEALAGGLLRRESASVKWPAWSPSGH